MIEAPPDSGFRRAEVQARYEEYAREHDGEIEIGNLCETMVNFGERNAIRAMEAFLDIPGRLSELERRFRDARRMWLAMWKESEPGQERLPF